MSATSRHKMDNKNDECSQRIKSYKNTRHGTPEVVPGVISTPSSLQSKVPSGCVSSIVQIVMVSLATSTRQTIASSAAFPAGLSPEISSMISRSRVSGMAEASTVAFSYRICRSISVFSCSRSLTLASSVGLDSPPRIASVALSNFRLISRSRAISCRSASTACA